MTKDLDFPIYRALVTYSSVNTGEIRVLIPSLSGLSSETTISFIGRSATSGIWAVPDVGTQIVVTADDYTFTNIFWVQIQPTSTPVFSYKVGDTGPGGGVIFFVDRFDEYTGFTYLEVAPVGTEVQRTWATGANWTALVSGADSRALGGGYQNTLDIVAQAGNVAATCAAAYCADLTSGGQSDWYLPSWAEIKMVNDVVHLGLSVGGFVFATSGLTYYWSSTENKATDGWSWDFYYGFLGGGPKNETYYVRPVRRF